MFCTLTRSPKAMISSPWYISLISSWDVTCILRTFLLHEYSLLSRNFCTLQTTVELDIMYFCCFLVSWLFPIAWSFLQLDSLFLCGFWICLGRKLFGLMQQVDTSVLGLSPEEAKKKPYIASMGIYVFKKTALLRMLRLTSLPNLFPGAMAINSFHAVLCQAFYTDDNMW